MIDLFLERQFAKPLTASRVAKVTQDAQGCLDIYAVRWLGSLLGLDGRRMVCRFQAPDTESARQCLRQAGADITRLWAGTVHDAQHAALGEEAPPPLDPDANVLVERSFAEPVSLADLQAIEDLASACLENHRVRFKRSCFSLNRRRMLCLYQAPDAESVRVAQRQAGMPFTMAWACRFIAPESAPERAPSTTGP